MLATSWCSARRACGRSRSNPASAAPIFAPISRLLRRGLLDNGYDELAITGEHAVAIANLPPIHKDPFDRLLVAQSAVEGILLLTADPIVAQYPGPVRQV
jgi:PIN domain nuclease of toxin-antitoxin system